MASLFLNPPSPSSLSVSKKQPTSTTYFSRYPLVKNPNLSLFRSSKTNSRKQLKFSASNNEEEEEEETKKTESSSMVNPLKEDNESKKTRTESNDLEWDTYEKEMDELLALLAQREKKEKVIALLALKEKKELNKLYAEAVQREKKFKNLLEKLEKTKSSSMVNPLKEDIEKLDKLIGEKELDKSMEKVVQKFEKTESSSKVTPLKEDEELGFGELIVEIMDYLYDPTIENAENIQLWGMNKKKSANPVFRHMGKSILEGITTEIKLLECIYIYSTLLNVSKMESCFERDTFFITNVRRVRYRWTFTGFLKKPIEEVMPKLEKKLSKAAGVDVIIYFTIDEYDMTKQVCTVEPKPISDFILDSTNQLKGNIPAIILGIASFGTTIWMSSFLLKPIATFDDYLTNVLPLFGGLFSILGVSEIATRITAARYGVKLSPSFLIPSIWTGFLGVVNNYESLLPNNKALFDIPAARTASAYLMSLVLVITAFVVDGSFNGGDNPMYISPGFFSYNSLLSYIQSVIGPFKNDFGNLLPYVVEGVGVPVNPLAFAGIIGVAVTSINLLPFRRMEGGRISQALFGHFVAEFLQDSLTILLLAIGVLDGNVLSLVWFLVVSVQNVDETLVKNEITPLGDERRALGYILQVICILTLFPNIAGRFSVFHFFGEIYEVISSSLSYNS